MCNIVSRRANDVSNEKWFEDIENESSRLLGQIFKDFFSQWNNQSERNIWIGGSFLCLNFVFCFNSCFFNEWKASLKNLCF